MKSQREILADWRFLGLVLLLTVTLAAGGLAVWWAKRWRQHDGEVDVAAPATTLDAYRELRDRGLLQPDEFAKIQARLEATPQPDAARPKETGGEPG